MKGSSTKTAMSRSNSWRPGQVGLVTITVLALGILVGYLFHGSSSAASVSSGNQTSSSGTSDEGRGAIQPLLERLKGNPDDPDLLGSIGNAYYDQHNYGQAVDYYRRYLDLRPQDVDVRTDMGTAIWYSGNAAGALEEYEKALSYRPDYPNTLFNLGIVKWQGEHDGKAAIASWERLLKVDPDYVDREKVEDLIRKVQNEQTERLIQKVQSEPMR